MTRASRLPKEVEAALRELGERLRELYGERLEHLYLYGSYARGTADEESDVDVLVVLRGAIEPGAEIARMTPIVSDICLAYDLLISTVPVSTDWAASRWNPFLVQVRHEAVPL